MQEGHELQFHLSAEQRSSFAAQLVTDFDKIETAIAQIDARDAEASFPQVSEKVTLTFSVCLSDSVRGTWN